MEKTERDLEQDNRKRIADNIKYLLEKHKMTLESIVKRNIIMILIRGI